jgi:hypothetical protein
MAVRKISSVEKQSFAKIAFILHAAIGAIASASVFTEHKRLLVAPPAV